MKKYEDKYKAKDPERYRILGIERMRRYRERHPERGRERYLRWKNKDPMRYEEHKRRTREERSLIVIFRAYFRKRLHRYLFGDNHYSKNKEAIKIKVAKYKKEHPAMIAANNNSRRAIKLMAQPPWVKREELLVFYVEAKRKSLITGIPHEVDHIWPLNGDGFVGLHVPWNLQIITKNENSKKFNKRPDRFYKCR